MSNLVNSINDITAFKCEFCDKVNAQDLKEKLLEKLYEAKSQFTTEDDFDTACQVVESVIE